MLVKSENPVDPGVNFGCFVSWWTTPASASLQPDKRFGFDLQCQLHPGAGASLQFPEGTAPPARPDLTGRSNWSVRAEVEARNHVD
jgi:hypothetical protein